MPLVVAVVAIFLLAVALLTASVAIMYARMKAWMREQERPRRPGQPG